MESKPQERPFRVCPDCGRLTPRHLPRCVECGAPSVQAMADEMERESEQRFARTFFMRGTPATWALIGANVAVFVLLAATARSVNPDDPSYTFALVAFGAKVNSLIDKGEYWRFVNPIFIHIGPMHLLVNMYSLYAIGPQVERLYGTARFLILYLVSGVAGVAASYYFLRRGDGPSAGASGALFGLLGVLFVFGVRYRAELPGIFRQAFSPRGLVPVLVLNLFITFAFTFIDKWAHLGGLFAGAALAAVIPYFRSNEPRASWVWRALATLCVIATLACFALAFRSYRGVPIVHRADVARFVEVFNGTNTSADAAIAAVAKDADRQAVLPEEADKARAAAAAARSGAGLDDESSALFERDAALLDRAAELLSARGARVAPGDAAALAAEDKAIDAAWNAWLERNGPNYSIGKEDNTNAPGGDDGS